MCKWRILYFMKSHRTTTHEVKSKKTMINKIYAQKLVVFFVRSENDYDKGQVSSWCLVYKNTP